MGAKLSVQGIFGGRKNKAINVTSYTAPLVILTGMVSQRRTVSNEEEICLELLYSRARKAAWKNSQETIEVECECMGCFAKIG